MSYSRDYIMRMLEMLTELVALIIGLIKKGDVQLAQKKINSAYKDFLKQDAAYFHALSVDKMKAELIEQHAYTNGHLQILSELFYLEAELSKTFDQKQHTINCFRKSLCILNFLEQADGSYSMEREQKKHTIKKELFKLQTN